jgi:hypothetical protein
VNRDGFRIPVLSSAQLEATVLDLVTAVIAGTRIEDDLVECKRTWPEVSKARQLAGAANSAHGSPLLLIIGLDEDARKIVSPDDTDPATWWARMSARFDQEVAPTLVRHLRIPVGEGNSVIALLFETDRAPYVVKNFSGGSPEREIPVRGATGTRSAHRTELLRMLAPTILTPRTTIIDAQIFCKRHDPEPYRPEQLRFTGYVLLYLEHTQGVVATIPVHQISAHLAADQLEVPLILGLPEYLGDGAPEPPPRWGVSVEHNQIVCTAPGFVQLRVGGEAPLSVQDPMSITSRVDITISLGVIGAMSPIRLSATLAKWDRQGRGYSEPGIVEVGYWTLDSSSDSG